MVIAHVQPLMSEDDCLPIGRPQVRLQPLQLRSGNVGVIPLRVLAAIRFAVIAKTGIQNHKMKIASIERIVGLLLLNSTQELGLSQRVDAMISKHIMTIFRDGTEFSINLLEVPLLGLNGIRSVDEIPQFDNEICPIFLKLGCRFGQLSKRLPVVATSGRGLVGVVQVGHKTNPQRILRVICQ